MDSLDPDFPLSQVCCQVVCNVNKSLKTINIIIIITVFSVHIFVHLFKFLVSRGSEGPLTPLI